MTDLGISMKAVAINVWSTVTFLLPVILLFKPDLLQQMAVAWVAIGVAAIFVPPFGWLKPHPWSDFPHNRS